MKTPSTFLYDLVSRLTKSEKRYIKVQSGSVQKDYLLLMDALLAQPSFDEAQLIQDNEGANFLKNLAVNKRYLYELLLRTLTQFRKKGLEDKVYEKISTANVLIDKGMFLAAISELKKGQKIADKYELFDLQIMICTIEKKLLSRQQFKKRDDNAIHRIFKKEADSLEQLKITSEYWYIAQQIVHFQTRYQNIQNETQKEYIDKVTNSPKFKNNKLATNFNCKLYFHQANAAYQFILGKVKNAYEINRQYLDLLESNPHFLELYAEQYLGTLNNMLIDSLVTGEYDRLEEGINRLVNLKERREFRSNKNIEARVFRQRYLLLINWNIRQNDFEKAIAWIPEIEAGLERFGKKIEKHHRITFYYLIAYLLFTTGRCDQALQWNNLILNDPKEDVVKEIYQFARILNLLIHTDLENYTLLESLLQSTPKYLKSRRAIYQTERALFRYLGKLINLADKKSKQKHRADFKDKLLLLFEIPAEKRVFNYLDLRVWVGD